VGGGFGTGMCVFVPEGCCGRRFWHGNVCFCARGVLWEEVLAREGGFLCPSVPREVTLARECVFLCPGRALGEPWECQRGAREVPERCPEMP